MQSSLKLPKDVLADPRHDAVVKLLTTHAGLLWEGGRASVATLPLTSALSGALRGALTARQACQGMELITEKLANEQKGLDVVRAKAPESPQNARVSRVLFVANDGSTRFYRDCESLLGKYSQRLMVCRIEVGGDEMGKAVLGTSKLVRSVLVFDKAFAAQALLSLVPQVG